MQPPGWPSEVIRRFASDIAKHNSDMLAQAARLDEIMKLQNDLTASSGLEEVLQSIRQHSRVVAELASDQLRADTSAIAESVGRSMVPPGALAIAQAQAERLVMTAGLGSVGQAFAESSVMQDVLASVARSDQLAAEMTRLGSAAAGPFDAAALDVMKAAHAAGLTGFAQSVGVRDLFDEVRSAIVRDVAVREAAEEPSTWSPEAKEEALDAAAAFATLMTVALIYVTNAHTKATGLFMLLTAEAWRGGVLVLEALGTLQEHNDATKGLVLLLEIALVPAMVALARRGRSEEEDDDR